MEKSISPTRYRSGINTLYISSRFIYEVSLYKITKSGAALLKSQYYASDKPIANTKTSIAKLDKDTTLVKYIDWLAAPKDYLVEHNYQEDYGNDNVRFRRKSNSKARKQRNKNSRS